ncbi:unnamed protein product, partial [Prorocentrum cordatum]
ARSWVAQAADEDLDGGDEDLWEAPEAVVPAPVEDGPVPIVPLAVAQGKCYCSTGYAAGGLEQCRFAWRALRVSSAEPPLRLRALFVESKEANPEAAWPAARLGPLVAAAAPARPAAVAKATGRPPAAAGPPRAPPGAAPFDDFLSVGGSSRGPGSELAADEEAAAAGGLGGKLAGARVRLEEGKRAAGDVNLDGFPLGAEAAGEGPVKKRSLGDLLVERAAKLKRAASDAGPRGSGDPVPERAPPGAGLSGGMAELAQALAMAIREGKEAPPGNIGGGGLGSVDPAAVPRDLATKRAFCRRMAAASPGRLTELSLQQVADFLGSQEIGVQTYRELRTLAEAVDLLMQGKAAHACDLIVQRLKALQVATTDGSGAAAEWWELIPPRDEPTAIRSEEEELIRSIQLGEMRLDELSARLASAKTPAPPPWKMSFAEMRKEFPQQPGGGDRATLCERGEGVAEPPLATALQCWSDELSLGFGKSIVAVDLAAQLAAAVRRRPGSLGHSARSFSMRADTFCGSGGSSNRRVRDALPLPLPSTEEVVRWLAHSALPKARRCRRRAVAREVSEQAWLRLSVVALNYAFYGRAQEGWRHRPALSEAQTQVYVHLKSRAAALAEDPLAMVVVPAIDELAGGCGSAYEGETGVKALPCRLCELAPGLPARECAATLDAIDFVDDEVGAWLRRPELALLDQSDWPDPLPRARVNVETEADWEELALHLVSLSIFTTLAESELVRVRGEPALNGLFAVEKKGTPAPGATRVTRPIPNMVPGNSLLKAHVGEAALLAASTSWTSVVIPEGKLLLWSGDDQKGAFFVWRVPPAWHPYMAVGRPLAGKLFGRSEPVVYVTSEVLARKLAGALSDLQLQVRASYERASASFSAEKAHCRQLRVERMGADVDGVSGRLAVPASKALATAGLCLAAAQRRLAPRRVAMAALGKLARAFEFRRPLFGVLSSVWTLAASSSQEAYLDAEMVEELLMGVMVLPLAASSLRARIDGMVTSSDASEMGGGVCTSAGLRENVAAALQVPRAVPDQLGIGARLLNMPEDCARPWAAANPRVPARAVRRVLSVLLIGLFDGIGGLAVAFSRLPFRIAAYVAAEADARARRVARLRRPGVIDWGDVTRVGSETVRDLFEAFGGLVDLAAVAAGSPCQDLSRLNVGGRGLSGRKSSLFHEVPRILALLAAVFRDRLVWFVENAASMSDVNGADLGGAAGEPRLFWTSWGVTASAPLRLTDRGVHDELVGPGAPPMDLAWEDEGCSWPGRPRYTSLATKGSNPQDASDARAFLLGNSFSIHVGAWLCQQLLHRRGALNGGLSIEELPPVRECRATWDQAGAFVTGPGEPDTAEARQLVLHYLSRAEKGGSDVRLDYGAPYRPRGWPRTSLDPLVWMWRVVVSMAWPSRSSTHINVRELQAATSAIRWRARKVAQRGSRFLHLVDSQVVAAIVTRGRSSSRKLQPILKRWMAVVVAADMYPLIGYVVSEGSPAWLEAQEARATRAARAAAHRWPVPVRRRGTRCQTLSSLKVSAETRRRYERALRALLAHFGAEQAGAGALRGDPEDADALVAEYLNGLWASGAGIAAASNTLAEGCFAAPRSRRPLDLSWTLLKAWRQHEPASRVLPLTTQAVAAMAGFACAAGAFDVAALLLVNLEGMLQGAEVFALTVGDIVTATSFKTTAGKDCAEAVVVRSRMAVALLRIAVRSLGAGARLSTARLCIEGAVAGSVRAQPGSKQPAPLREDCGSCSWPL